MDDNILFKLSSFDDIYAEFNNLLNIIEDNVDEYSAVLTELDGLYGAVFAQYTNNIEECKNNEQKFKDYIENMQTVFDEVKDTSDKNFEPVTPSKITKLNTNQIKQTINGVIEILDTAINQDLFKESTTVTNWIDDRNRELDDTFLEAVLNPIDEHRQKEAEQIFNDNETLYNDAIDEMEASVSFHDEIDNLESYLKKIGKFDELFGNVKEDNLFDTYSMSVVQATSSDKIKFEKQQQKEAHLESDYTASDEKLKGLHVVLDIGGLLPIPLVSQVCDIANGIIYTLEGEGLNALLSIISAFPVVGTLSGLAKYGDELIDGLGKAGKSIEKVEEISKGSNGIKSTLSQSMNKYDDLDQFLDKTLKPLLGIGVGAVEGDEYDMGMSGAGLASSNAFGWIEELDMVKNLDLFKILLN